MDLTFSEEFDFIPDLLWWEAKEDEAGRPLTELLLSAEVFWLWVDLEWEAFPPILEWYLSPYTFFLDSNN